MNDNSVNSSIRDNEINKKKINRIMETNRRVNHVLGSNNSSSTKTTTTTTTTTTTPSSGNSSTLQYLNNASEMNQITKTNQKTQNQLTMSNNNNNKRSSTILIQKFVFYLGITMIVNSLILSLRHHGSILRVVEHQHSRQDELEILSTLTNDNPDTTGNDIKSSKRQRILRYQENNLCNGCQLEYSDAKKATTCQKRMMWHRKKNPKLLIEDIGTVIAENNPRYCYRCNPNVCSKEDKFFYRPDDIINSFIEYDTTHTLQSIHINHRVKNENKMVNSLNNDHLLSNQVVKPDQTTTTIEHQHQYLYEYNPSIIILPDNQIPKTIPDAVYLSSYRVSSMNSCIPKDKNEPNDNNNNINDYLGLALLNKNLQIIQETVVDIKKVIDLYQDGRLYILNNQIYLGSYHRINPIWIVPPNDNDMSYQINEMGTSLEPITTILPFYYQDDEKIVVQDPITDNNINKIQKEKERLSIYVRKSSSCTTNGLSHHGGRNINYFVDAMNRTIIELFPMGPKEILNINKICETKSKRDKSNDFLNQTQNVLPLPSFGTTDELEWIQQKIDWLPYSFERGSICCISMNDPRSNGNGNNMLLGISHSKTQIRGHHEFIHQNHYLSSFYAIEAVEPYNVIARSGRFCLGYSNQHNIMTIEPLRIGHETYNKCPRIHFITGMTEKADDPNKVIISYGINDCISRFIVIDKTHIIRLLFHPNELVRSKDDSTSVVVQMIEKSMYEEDLKVATDATKASDEISTPIIPVTTPNKQNQESDTTSQNEFTVKSKVDTSNGTLSAFSRRKTKKMLRFQRNILCPGCRLEFAQPKKKLTCQRKLSWYTKMITTMSVEEAATTIAEEHNNTCYRCNPNNCSDDDKIYYRPDDIVNSFIESSITHRLQSIHEDHRIPKSIFNSPYELSKYLSDKKNVYPQRQYFYEFNPSIIALPKNQIPNSIPDAVYLTAYRVSSMHACLSKEIDGLNMKGGSWDRKQDRDYLGLALVDKNLQILVETVVDVDKVRKRFYQDGRLFVLKDQIYLGSGYKIHPIWIIPPTSENKVDKINYYQVDKQTGTFEQLTVVLPEYYNEQKSSERTTSNRNGKLTVYMRKTSSCTTNGYAQHAGKNFNYFVDTNDRIIMELFPMGNKEILHVNKECVGKGKKDHSNDFLSQSANEVDNIFPPPSFGTTDEIELLNQNIDWFPYTSERGSICCISIKDPRNISQSLLLGISHSKTPHKNDRSPDDVIHPNHYFSSFYAMEPNEPYNVVARSGRFCLGYPSYNRTHPSVDDELQEPYPKMYLDPLTIASETYNRCPRIHFVMGMIEKVDDPNKIIISYGVDDCLSRFIVIDKKHIIRLLFYPQKLLRSRKNKQTLEKDAVDPEYIANSALDDGLTSKITDMKNPSILAASSKKEHSDVRDEKEVTLASSNGMAIESRQKSNTIDTIRISSLTYADNQNMRNASNVIRYQENVVCHGCQFGFVDSKQRSSSCQRAILRLLNQNAMMTLQEAAIQVAEKHPDGCYRCNPNNCSMDEKILYRPDDVVNSLITFATTHRLSSIPENSRIPESILNSPSSLSSYLADKKNVYPERQYLYEFNPSIIPLPKGQIPAFAADAVYLASYRVSSTHTCLSEQSDWLNMIGGSMEYANMKHHNDYLGFALLDKDLKIILDAVFDVKQVQQIYQDGRLYALNNQIYWSSYHVIHPIWIVPPPGVPGNDKRNIYQVEELAEGFDKLTTVLQHFEGRPNENGNDKGKTSPSKQLNIYMRNSPSCTTFGKNHWGAKNMNYFIDSINRTIIEIYPMGDKEVLNISKKCHRESKRHEIHNYLPPSLDEIPMPSFDTTDEMELVRHNIDWVPYTRDRGSTCCVSIIDPRNGQSLLLGISHSKIPFKKGPEALPPNSYFSSFYAMERNEPFNVVARTGRFCMEYPYYNVQNSLSEIKHPYPRLYLDPLKIGNETYHRCPRIHFVSGMTEKVDEPNKIIIAYGVEDCASRFVVIDKQHIIDLLFHSSVFIDSKNKYVVS